MTRIRGNQKPSPEVERAITEYYSRPEEEFPPPDGDETKTHFFRSMIESGDEDRRDELCEEKSLDN